MHFITSLVVATVTLVLCLAEETYSDVAGKIRHPRHGHRYDHDGGRPHWSHGCNPDYTNQGGSQGDLPGSFLGGSQGGFPGGSNNGGRPNGPNGGGWWPQGPDDIGRPDTPVTGGFPDREVRQFGDDMGGILSSTSNRRARRSANNPSYLNPIRLRRGYGNGIPIGPIWEPGDGLPPF
ncbi:hypothetical protein Q1695_008151 [Nippostrongylus brasiliensis]|nr:hypothetical protein Q1695_008151 [Nippostrongylus brasiliensis]